MARYFQWQTLLKPFHWAEASSVQKGTVFIYCKWILSFEKSSNAQNKMLNVKEQLNENIVPSNIKISLKSTHPQAS